MASNNTVTEAICDLKTLGLDLRLRSYLTPEEIHNLSYMINSNSDEIFTAHKREVEERDTEIAELREFSNDMRTWFRLYYSCGSFPESKWWRSCASCRRKRCPIHKWRKALEGEKK